MNTMKKFAILALLPVALLFTGCSVQGSTTPDTHASAAAKPSASVQTDPLLKGFGGIITYKDGVSVSVSTPAPYTPSLNAAGGVAGESALLFTFVVTNNSKVNVDIAGYPSSTSGGQQADAITDIGNNVGDTPATTLLPTQSIKWVEAFSVANPTDITIQYTPNFTYAKAIFNSTH